MEENTVRQKLISRRDFIGKTAAGAAAFTIVPRFVLGGKGFTPPSDLLNIASIGVGGMGHNDVFGMSSLANIHALCDVDEVKAGETFAEFPKAKRYTDFRVMLDKEHKHIDAVTVSTPDHTHAAAAMYAMKLGKHVYVQKPLTHTVYEARRLAEVAKEKKLVTIMGNQGHTGEGARLLCEWIWDGAIGDIYEVHTWTDRPYWPQGVKKPQEIPSVPPTLDWNLWLGPASWRAYHEAYAPFVWRGWHDFGTGCLGDMGAHILDQPFWALKLGAPETIQASSTPRNEDTYPLSSMITYTFPARENMGPVKLIWYDGGLMPPRPKELEDGRRMGEKGGGCIFYGTKGVLMCSVYGEQPRIIPETKMQEYTRPPKTIPRSPGVYQEWVDAIKTNGTCGSNFDYASKLTETMLLGNIALRMADQTLTLRWDAKNMSFTNCEEANQFLHKEYRSGWTLE